MDEDDFSFLDGVVINEDFLRSFKEDSESGLDLPPPTGQLPVENAVNQDPGPYQNSELGTDLPPLVGQLPVGNAVNQDPGPNQSSELGLDFPPPVGQFPVDNPVNQDPGPDQTSELGLDLPPEPLPFQGQSKAPAENADSVLTIDVNESDSKFLESFFQENEDQDTLNGSVIKFVESLLQEDEEEDSVQVYKPPQDTLNEYMKSLESLLQEDDNQPTVQVYQSPQDALNESGNIVLKNQAAGCVVKENHPLLIPVAEPAPVPSSEKSDDQAEDEVLAVPVMIDGVYIWEKAKGVACSLNELASLGVNGIAGRVSCSSCNEAYDMTLPLSRRKLDEFQAFFSRPDRQWERASPLKCTKCGEISAFGDVTNLRGEQDHVNWLFFFLAKQLCNCSMNQINHFMDISDIPRRPQALKSELVLHLYEHYHKLLLQ